MKRLVVAAALSALALSGCGNGPLEAGAAAIVGDTRITTGELDRIVSRGLKDPNAQQNVGTDRPSFERTVLRRLIDHEILRVAAAREKVSVTAGEALAARTRIAEQLGGEESLRSEALKAGISAEDLDITVRDVALRDALADKLTASIPVSEADLARAYSSNQADFDKVRSAHILVPTNALAQELLKQVKAKPARFAELAAQHSTDPASKGRGGELGFQGRGALDKTFEAAIFGNKPGSFVVVKTEFGFHVVHVIERRTVSLQAARTDLRRQLLSQPRNDAVQARLVAVSKELGVTVNPRFGTWDPKALDVVPAGGGNPATTESPRPGEAPPQPPVVP